MLDVNFEFSRGILFVRLYGILNKKSIDSVYNNLIDIITKGGIKFLVFNLSNSKLEEKIEMFDKCNSLIKKNKGHMYICGFDDDIDKVISSKNKYWSKINNEYDLKDVDLCLS